MGVMYWKLMLIFDSLPTDYQKFKKVASWPTARTKEISPQNCPDNHAWTVDYLVLLPQCHSGWVREYVVGCSYMVIKDTNAIGVL